jgi:hypothetical protein
VQVGFLFGKAFTFAGSTPYLEGVYQKTLSLVLPKKVSGALSRFARDRIQPGKVIQIDRDKPRTEA